MERQQPLTPQSPLPRKSVVAGLSDIACWSEFQGVQGVQGAKGSKRSATCFGLRRNAKTSSLKPFRLICLAIFTTIIALQIGCNDELAKWEFAAAQIQFEEGETEPAISKMRDVVTRMNYPPRLTVELATRLAEQGDRESIELCDRLIGRQPNELPLLNCKADCQQYLGDFPEALATHKQFLSDHVQRSDSELNNLAYYRALAGTELTLAAENSRSAIEQRQFRLNWKTGESLTLAAKAAVANAVLNRYLQHLIRRSAQGDPSKLVQREQQQLQSLILTQSDNLRLLSIQVKEYEAWHQQLEIVAKISDTLQTKPDTFFDDNEQAAIDMVATNEDLVRENLSTLLTARALLYQDLDNLDACNADRFRVQQLTHDADQVASQLPSPLECLTTLEYALMYLDTLGFIQSQLPWRKSDRRNSRYREAIGNFDLAVQSAKHRRLTFESRFANSMVPIPEVHQLRADSAKHEAVLRYHRLLANQRAGFADQVEADRAEIKALGFEPNEKLF